MLDGANISSEASVEIKATFEEYEFEHFAKGVHEKIKAKVALLLAKTAVNSQIWIGCETATGSAVWRSGGDATGTVNFTNCFTEILQSIGHMGLSAPCKPKEPVKAGGLVQIILHNGIPAAKVRKQENRSRPLCCRKDAQSKVNIS